MISLEVFTIFKKTNNYSSFLKVFSRFLFGEASCLCVEGGCCYSPQGWIIFRLLMISQCLLNICSILTQSTFVCSFFDWHAI